MLKKKGQAALEFLTTYGWAFLVILVMIGALAYFGVLNPARFVPDTCTFSGAFLCDTHVVNTGDVIIKLRNNVEQINVTAVTITDIDTGTVYTVDDMTALNAGCQTETASALICDAGTVMTWTFATASASSFAPAYSAGSKKRFSVDITYFATEDGATFSRTTGGDVVGTVQ